MDFSDLPYEDIIQYLEWHDQPIPEDHDEAYDAAYELLAYTEENIPESILDWYNQNVWENWEYYSDEEEEEKVEAINQLEMLPEELHPLILKNLNCRDLTIMKKISSKINNLIKTSDFVISAIKNSGFLFDLTKLSPDQICKLSQFLSVVKPGLAYIIGKGNGNNFQGTVGNLDLLSYSQFVKISAATSHCLLLDSTGSVYIYARGLHKIPDLSGIIDISAGRNVSFLLDVKGHVYISIANKYGQLVKGRSWLKGYDDKFVRNDYLSNIISVSTNISHSLFLSTEGKVYGYGSDKYGELGLNTQEGVEVPPMGEYSWAKLIPQLPIIKAIQTGWEYSLFLSTDGTVYCCGSNVWGQLGIGGSEKIIIPTPIPGLQNIISISARHNHSLFLTGKGKVYGCGDNSHGQLGILGQSIITVPTLIPQLPPKITKIFAGVNNSFFLTPEGQLYQCGSRCDDEQQIEPPHPVFKMSDVISVSDAEGCTLFLKNK